MGTLRSTDPLCQGAVVNGVTLGEPAWTAYDEDGQPAPGAEPVWDDHRIPDGSVEVTAPPVEGGPLPLPEAEQTGGGLGAQETVLDYVTGPVPVRVRIPIAAADVEPILVEEIA